MKANYLPKNRSRHPYLKQVSILVAIFVIGAFLFSIFDTTIISIASPIWKAENTVTRTLRNSLAFFTSRNALIAENAQLKERLYSLEAQITSLSDKQAQESTLLELVGRREKPSIVAGVLTRPPQTPYDVIIIDVGSNESVTSGSEVSLPEGPILGTVSEVFPKEAKVKLFSAAGQQINAVLERNNIPVTLEGRGGGNFKLTLPRDVLVVEGDRILSSRVTSPLLAVVEEISMRSTDSFQEVLAKSPTNIFTLRFVFVTP